MKAEIHPNYKKVSVVCSCGNSFTTCSTLKDDTLHLDICSECHPFYTGKQKIIDTAGRVDRFKQKYSKNKAKLAATAAQAKEQKEAKEATASKKTKKK